MNQNYNSSDLHIIDYSDDKSILYYVKTNTIMKIPSQLAIRILQYQHGEKDFELEKILDEQFKAKDVLVYC